MGKKIAFIICACAAWRAASAAEPPALAAELEADGEYAAAAASLRRRALLEEEPLRAAGWFYLAAENYSREGKFALSDKMLDRAEDAAPDALAVPAALMRAENAFAAGIPEAADFHFESAAAARGAAPGIADYARRGRAASKLMAWDIDGAEALFAPDSAEALAIREYRAGRGKSPRLGGLLGLAPGLGYAYSGEYGNALRSLLLNALFMWGMIECAEREQWGAFAAVSFFELTWYSGSIYGGVDAAHRRNRERLEGLVERVRGEGGAPAPDRAVLPLIQLKFGF